jgi:hypothetical protein
MTCAAKLDQHGAANAQARRRFVWHRWFAWYPVVVSVEEELDQRRLAAPGFTTLESWLSDYDLLFLKRNNADPLVVVPWRTYQEFLRRK